MNNQNGIAVLGVVILTSTLIIIGMLMWHITQLNHSLISKQTDRYKIERLTEGILNYAIAYVIENNPKDSETIIISSWPPGNDYYDGKIICSLLDDAYLITAEVFYNDKAICSEECILSTSIATHHINEWSIRY